MHAFLQCLDSFECWMIFSGHMTSFIINFATSYNNIRECLTVLKVQFLLYLSLFLRLAYWFPLGKKLNFNSSENIPWVQSLIVQSLNFLADSSFDLFIFVPVVWFFFTGLLALNPVSINHCWKVFEKITMREFSSKFISCYDLITIDFSRKRSL